MADLDRLLREADRVRAPDLWPDIRGREPRQLRERRAGVVFVALGLAAAGLALAAMAFLGEREQRRAPAATPIEVDPRVTAEIDVGRFPQEIAVGEGAVWVSVSEGDRSYIARIDPASNEVTDRVDVRAVDVAVGAGWVWAITFERPLGWGVVRIDPHLRAVVEMIPLDCRTPCSLNQLVVSDDLWVTGSVRYPESGQVIRVNPVTGAVKARIEVPGDPRDLVLGEGGVWVYSLTHFRSGCCVAGGTIYKIDPIANSVAATLLNGEVPPVAGISGPPVLTVGEGSVWTIRLVGEGPDEDLVRIDPRTNEVEPVGIVGNFHPFAVGEGGLWVRASRQPHSVMPVAISRLNPETLQIDEALGIDELAVDAALDPGTGTIWLANYGAPVMRVDLR
jgi:streptogramin lyase